MMRTVGENEPDPAVETYPVTVERQPILLHV